MSINIKNREAERLLAEIKQATGKGTSAVVLDLLRAEKERLKQAGDEDREKRWRALRDIQARVAAAESPFGPTVEEIMEDMYDENGLPK